ncbi:heme-binding protein [Pseudarthrobacter sp. J64]|uniref:heme-binding protein n=1 Tax=Pseudarthrobacter sp. J64 TaxID=3116485 RepID=UPI003FA6DCF2
MVSGVAFAGGIPLARDGNVAGAVGVSGGTGGQDQEIAEAAASVITRPQSARTVAHGQAGVLH